MLHGSYLAGFLVSSTTIILLPGPSVMFTIARGIAWGRAIAVLNVVGNSLGTFSLACLMALGLGPLISSSKTFSTVLQVCGGSYLLWLGFQTVRHREEQTQAVVAPSGDKPSAWAAIRQGFVVGVLNPKSLVFFVAVFPHFVSPSSGNATVQLFTMGAIFSVMAFCGDGTWGMIAGTARTWFATSPNRIKRMRLVGASVMSMLGLVVIASALLSVA